MDQRQIIAEQMRKARWYAYMCRRFNLVSFEDIADWCAREAGSVERSDAKREQALQDLENSVTLGEFGPPDRRLIPCFPKPPPVGEPRWAIKLSAGQILWMRNVGHLVTPYLHITGAQARKWLDARDIAAPPWLIGRNQASTTLNESVAVAYGVGSTEKKPFDDGDAKRLLVSRKIAGGPWPQRPAREDVFTFFKLIYATAPRDRVDRLMREVWGAGKTGPRPRKTHQKNAATRLDAEFSGRKI